MPKTAKKRARTPESDESGRDDGGKSSAKKSKTSRSEEQFWELSANRRVTVSQYNKNWLVNIREYYKADGEMKPAKKGISLSIEQYKALLKSIPDINEELKTQGIVLNDDDSSDESSDADKEGGPAASVKKESKKKPAPKKANIEATSDEESH